MNKRLCNYYNNCKFKNCRCKKKHYFTEGACGVKNNYDVKNNYCPEDQECLEMVEPEPEEVE